MGVSVRRLPVPGGSGGGRRTLLGIRILVRVGVQRVVVVGVRVGDGLVLVLVRMLAREAVGVAVRMMPVAMVVPVGVPHRGVEVPAPGLVASHVGSLSRLHPGSGRRPG
jgi:hypothetical protein